MNQYVQTRFWKELVCARSVIERENVLNLCFIKSKPAKEISVETWTSWNTIKRWIRRYRMDNDVVMRSNQYAHESEAEN